MKNKHEFRSELRAEFKDHQMDHDQVSGVKIIGSMEGYLNTWGEDRVADDIKRGAYKDWLAQLKKSGKRIPLLVEHDHAKLVGYWDTNSLVEDEKGLRGKAYFVDTPEGRTAYTNAKMLSDSYGLSIGFFALEYSYNKSDIREITKAELFETSLVVLPANADSGIINVKTPKDIERGLRDLGYSRKQAREILYDYKTPDGDEFELSVEELETEIKLLTDELTERTTYVPTDEEKSVIGKLANMQMSFG